MTMTRLRCASWSCRAPQLRELHCKLHLHLKDWDTGEDTVEPEDGDGGPEEDAQPELLGALNLLPAQGEVHLVLHPLFLRESSSLELAEAEVVAAFSRALCVTRLTMEHIRQAPATLNYRTTNRKSARRMKDVFLVPLFNGLARCHNRVARIDLPLGYVHSEVLGALKELIRSAGSLAGHGGCLKMWT